VTDEGGERAIVDSLADPSRFAVVVERHLSEIYRYLVLRVGETEAEDLTAETFTHAFSARRRYDPARGSVRAWLYGIATNLARHNRRDARRETDFLASAAARPAGTDPVDSATRLSDRARLMTALGSIDPGWRDVVFLIAVVGLTYEESAATLGIPVGTVRSRYSRARARLVVVLGARVEPDSPEGATR
jgi:RNA polymerase sigma factor (sigma-70 family)